MAPASDGTSLLELAKRGNLSEREAIMGLIGLGADEELLVRLGVSSAICAGLRRLVSDTVSWVLKRYAGRRELLSGIIAFFLATSQLNAYTVKKGDTLWRLAGGTWEDVDKVVALNPGMDENTVLRPGDKIVLPQEVAKDPGKPARPADEKPDRQPLDADELERRIDFLGRVIYSETSLADDDEVRLVCRVILNRIGRSGFKGNSDAYSIVSVPGQFHCTSGNDGNSNWTEYDGAGGNSRMKRAREYARLMIEKPQDKSWAVPKNAEAGVDYDNIVYYCNRSRATRDDAVGKVPWNDGGKMIEVGHPAGFGNVVPVHVTDYFVFFEKKK